MWQTLGYKVSMRYLCGSPLGNAVSMYIVVAMSKALGNMGGDIPVADPMLQV